MSFTLFGKTEKMQKNMTEEGHISYAVKLQPQATELHPMLFRSLDPNNNTFMLYLWDHPTKIQIPITN